MSFTIHNESTAPEAARETLTRAKAKYGFLPNLLGVMANAPSVLQAYANLGQSFDQSSFTPTERQIVLLATSYHNDCTYCVAAHSVIAGMQKVPQDVIAALREGRPLADPKLQALRQFTAETVLTRGWPSEAARNTFTAAGYGPQQMLEVVLGVTMKTLSNYVNHQAETPLDPAFGGAAWTKAA
ncbi:MAG: carboxymuconolactone decarboxylase family protein [Lysobacterales bacterium]